MNEKKLNKEVTEEQGLLSQEIMNTEQPCCVAGKFMGRDVAYFGEYFRIGEGKVAFRPMALILDSEFMSQNSESMVFSSGTPTDAETLLRKELGDAVVDAMVPKRSGN